MNTPPFLLGAAILFWGWLSEQWIIAILAVLLFEGARGVSRRWAFEGADFNRVADFCSVLAAALGVVLYLQFGNPVAIKLWFQWLPLALAPLAAMQAYSTSKQIDLSVLVWSMRRVSLRRPLRFALGYPYLACWLLAASAANSQGPAFYIGMAALSAWALWSVRLPGASPVAWGALFALAAGIGYTGHIGLHQLQIWLEANVPEWMAAGERTDPYRSRTDIGAIGELKLSGKILMRVVPESRLERPLLLHRASYNDYVGTTWIARGSTFAAISPGPEPRTWELSDTREKTRVLAIDEDNAQTNPVLALPPDTARIEDLAASDMKRNSLGAVQVETAPGPLRYRARYGAGDSRAPEVQDLSLPRAEAAVLRELSGKLGLDGLSDSEAAQRIVKFFSEGFQYAIYRDRPAPAAGTALADFLLSTRAGHCEYFAAATVLLLRAAGVPARYATGFSVQEYSDLERAYVVRLRHAHAWARAYVRGEWRDLDTTPAQWFSLEAGDATATSRLADLWYWAGHRVSRSVADVDRETRTWLMLAVAAGFLALLAWRLLRGRAPAMVLQGAGAAGEAGSRPGADSEFYAVEALAAKLGCERAPSESWSEWLARIGPRGLLDEPLARTALELHTRCRFDPAGLAPEERARLARTSRELNERLERLQKQRA